MKMCSNCKKTKSLTEFYKHPKGRLGVMHICKQCEKDRVKKWCSKNKEKVEEYQKNYRKSYYLKNKGYILEKSRKRDQEYMKRYYIANKDKINKITKQWKINNPDKIKSYLINRKARKRNADGTFTGREWSKLKQLYKYTCLKCGRREPQIKLTPDHVVPLVLGGSNKIENIQPLCLSCNCSKNTKSTDYRIMQTHLTPRAADAIEPRR